MLFISLEGLDGVGKTTVTKMLAEELAGVAVQTPQPELHEVRRHIDRGNAFVRFHFYTSSLYLLDEFLSIRLIFLHSAAGCPC